MVSRRKVLETGLKGFAALSLYTMGCSNLFTPTPEIKPSSYKYPRLEEGKIQPPEEGCWIGFYPFSPGYPEKYKEKLGKHPKLFTPQFMSMGTNFDSSLVENIYETGSTPMIYCPIENFSYKNLEDLTNDIDFRENVKNYAQDVVKTNKKIFFTTMREMNHSTHSYGQQPETAKEVWRLMHDIFTDEGANELTTWFWEIYCPRPGAERTDYPAWYWPGDEYVDYIGLSAFSRDGYGTGNESFSSLIGSTLHNLHDRYPDKPIMVTEFGKTQGNFQDSWIQGAFKYIKENPEIKGAVYMNNVLANGHIFDNHLLNESSFNYLKNLFRKDPYFIFADYQGKK